MASGSMSAGVPISLKTVGVSAKASAPMVSVVANMMYAEFAMARFTLPWSWAPKYWAVTMPPPEEMPLQTEKNRNVTEPVAPTAASAPAPMNWPTMTESAML